MSAVTAPFFLQGTRGRLFAIHFHPAQRYDFADSDAVLYFPAFADELNKSRRMVALQARAFADVGIPVLLVDLHGTGDSQGDFSEATWDGWLADMAAAVEWMQARGAQRIVFWGLRLGALLAAETALHFRSCNCLLFWAPVVRGDVFLNQFLRLRTAADLIGQAGGTSVSALNARLDVGESLEIAGYQLPPVLAAAMQKHRLQDLALSGHKVAWFDVSTSPTGYPAPAVQQVLDAWRKKDCRITHRAVSGEPFWITPEITTVPALIQATLKAMVP